MIYNDFLSLVYSLVDQAVSQSWDVKRLKQELKRRADRAGLQNFLENFQQIVAVQYDWLNSRTMKEERRQYVNIIFQQTGIDFAHYANRINTDIFATVAAGIRAGDSSGQIRNEIAKYIGRHKGYYEAITRTALSGFDTAARVSELDENARLRLVGPPPERTWCKDHLNKTFTKKEILSMSNGTKLPPILYRGGYRCRHPWQEEL